MSDDLLERMELNDLGAKAQVNYLRLASWSMRLLTDGAIPRSVAHRIALAPDADDDLDALVQAGYLDVTPEGWQFPNWEKEQRTRAQVEADRAEARGRQQKSRRNRAEAIARRETAHAAGDHRWCSAEFCALADRHAVTQVVTSDVSHGYPDQNPTDPDQPPQGAGAGIGTGDAARAQPSGAGAPSADALRSDVPQFQEVAGVRVPNTALWAPISFNDPDEDGDTAAGAGR